MNFLEVKNMVFLSQNGNMIFNRYWKVLVLIFSGMGSNVFFEPKSWWKDYIYWLQKGFSFELFRAGKYGTFFWVKKLIEWYLLVIEKFLFSTFWWLGIQSFFAKKLMERWYLLGLIEVSMIFRSMGNMTFHAVRAPW